jgi:hypothetical protein
MLHCCSNKIEALQARIYLWIRAAEINDLWENIVNSDLGLVQYFRGVMPLNFSPPHYHSARVTLAGQCASRGNEQIVRRALLLMYILVTPAYIFLFGPPPTVST